MRLSSPFKAARFKASAGFGSDSGESSMPCSTLGSPAATTMSFPARCNCTETLLPMVTATSSIRLDFTYEITESEVLRMKRVATESVTRITVRMERGSLALKLSGFAMRISNLRCPRG